MKFSKLILFFCLIICLIAPVSAWEQSFEGSINDESISKFISSGPGNYPFSIIGSEHGYAIYTAETSSTPASYTQTLTINEPWLEYFSFSYKQLDGMGMGGGGGVYVTLYNGSSIVWASPLASVPNNLGLWHRIEVIDDSAHTGASYYLDGAYIGNSPYLSDSTKIDKYIISFSSGFNSANHVWLDDFSTSPATIFSDDTVIPGLGLGQYYRVGCELGGTSGDASFYTKAFSPEGNTLQQTITNYSEQLIPMSFFNESGTYFIKLYQSDESGSHYFPVATKYFTYILPGATQLSIDKKDYSPGETIFISAYAKDYTGYKIVVPYYDSSGKLQLFTYTLTSSDVSLKFTIPETARGGSFVIYLKDSNGLTKSGVQYNCLASGGLTSLKIDKTVYAPGDTVKISYSNMPENTQISMRLQKGNALITSNSWNGVSGSGVVSYQLSSSNADNFLVSAISGNTALGQTTGTIISGIYYLSGHIIDPSSGSTIPGANISIGSSSTTSDINGAFNFSVPAGWQDLSITKTGYQANLNKVNIVYPIATQDFYVVKSYSGSGHSLYGLVTDYYTGAPVSSAYISLKQGSITHNLFSYTNTGYYIQDSEDMTGNWTVTVSKSGYYTSTQIVSVSGDTYNQIILTPTKYSSTGDTGSSDGSGGEDGSEGSGSGSGSGSSSSGSTDAATIDSTGVSQDRPGREAAKNSLEQFEEIVPGLLGLVIFRVVMELVG